MMMLVGEQKWDPGIMGCYQIDPREAVPEVSKGKGYINQKMCL